jgi:hypothetical protein
MAATPTPKLRLADDAWKTAMQKADEACRLAATELDRRERIAREKVLAWMAGKADIPAELAAAGQSWLLSVKQDVPLLPLCGGSQKDCGPSCGYP